MAGTSYLYAEALTGGMATASLPLMTSIGGDTEYGMGSATLPLLAGTGEGGFYVPVGITEGYGTLPYLVGYATGNEDDAATGSVTLPLLSGIGADYDYGIGYGMLPTMYAMGSAGGMHPEDELWLISGAYGASGFAATRDILLILNSDGSFESSFAMTRQQALALLSNASGSSYFVLRGIFGLSLQSGANALSMQAMNLNDAPDLHDNGVVWVVNMANRASSQYEQYGFNSFFERDGVFYGVANDGIYKLEGDNDVNELIDALAVLPRTNLGIPKQKRVNAVYLGVSSTAEMILKIEVDDVPVYYTARSHGDLKNHRVDTGKGQIGNYWQFTVMNQDGCDFSLAGIEFVPVVLGRRI